MGKDCVSEMGIAFYGKKRYDESKLSLRERRRIALERNESFATGSLNDLSIRLAWAQVEIFGDEIDRVQVLAAGDENSVRDLRIVADDEGVLTVEQPQYGLSLNITESHWMQVCVRVPKTWNRKIHVNTVSGLLNARGLNGSVIILDTVSGDLHASRVTAEILALKTVSGDIRADTLAVSEMSARSLSGNLSLDSTIVKAGKFTTVNGEQTIRLTNTFEQLEVRTVSGDVALTAPVEKMNVSMRSISGRVSTDGVQLAEEAGLPAVRITGVSANLKLICVKQ